MKLFVRVPGKEPYTVDLTQPKATIGRSASNTVCLEDPFASRVHTEIRCDGDTCWLTDLGSANGTLVNGHRISETVRVAPGDKVRIGDSLLEVVLPSERTPPTPPGGSGEAGPTQTLVSKPETVVIPARKSQAASGLLSVIETVRYAADVKELPAGIGRSQELMAVISDVGIALLSPLSLDEVLSQIVGLIFDAIPADRAFLFLRGTPDTGLVCKVASYRSRELNERERSVQISRAMTEEVVGKGQAVLTSDALSDARFREQASIISSGIRSIMAVPLSVNRQVLGMIYVDSPMNVNRFTKDDLRLVTTIASVAAIKIENALLLEQRIENERIKQQLDSAREIQGRLLPVEPPVLPGYDLIGSSVPCFEVGGDYFDFIDFSDGTVGIALGDVSGKGIDAAMLMSSLHACVRAQTSTRSPISAMMAAVNRYIYQNTPPNKFVTLFYGELDSTTHRLRYTNAGHNPPILVRSDGAVENLQSGGVPVGILRGQVYSEEEVHMAPGDTLILYSDGITESTSEAGEEFGVPRLLDVVRDNREQKAPKLMNLIDEAIARFGGKARPVDDASLVIVQRMSSPGDRGQA